MSRAYNRRACIKTYFFSWEGRILSLHGIAWDCGQFYSRVPFVYCTTTGLAIFVVQVNGKR
jgi:hypothetical protein